MLGVVGLYSIFFLVKQAQIDDNRNLFLPLLLLVLLFFNSLAQDRLTIAFVSSQLRFPNISGKSDNITLLVVYILLISG